MNLYLFFASFFVLMAQLSFAMELPTNNGMQVKIFNVGQGNCAVVTKPGQPSLLVDAGSDQLPGLKSTIISDICSHLHQHSQNGICILISHAEKDHAGWMPDIISRFSGLIRNITVGGPVANYAKLLPQNQIPIFDCNTIISRNPEHLPSYCSLWATGFAQQATNDQSLVVCVEDADFRVILPGDSGGKTFNQQTIVPSNKPTYFVANHHGSQQEGANSAAILQSLAPCAILVSSGMHGRYFHPTSNTLDAFAQATYPTQGQQYINGQTAPNLMGNLQNQAVVNYANKFSTYRTNHPIFTTNSMGNITISSQGLFTSTSVNSPIETLNRSYFKDFYFHNIIRLFLARSAITDEILHGFSNLPNSLSYFDLQNNHITAHGISRLIELLQQRKNPQSLVIKTKGNNKFSLETLKWPLQQLSSQPSAITNIQIAWNQPVAWIADGIDGLHYNQTDSLQQKRFPSNEELAQFLVNCNANRSSSSFCWDYSELFAHTPEKTTWYDFSTSQSIEFNIPHITAGLRAKKSNSFLFSNGTSSIIYDQGFNQQYASTQLAGRMPYAPPQNMGSSTHISTGFATGNGLQELNNLMANKGYTCNFEIAHPISDDGTAILTVEHHVLNFWKKVNFQWILKQRYAGEKAIQYAGFNDLNRSILITFADGSQEQLPLALEAASA